MEDGKIRKPWIDALFLGRKVIKLVSYLRLECNIDLIYQGMSFYMHKDTSLNVNSHKHTFYMWNRNSYSRKFWENSLCKCDHGKSKIIHKDICMKEPRLWGWGLYVRQCHSAS